MNRLSFAELRVKAAPTTWLPALLATCVEAAHGRKVFKGDDATEFVACTEEKLRQHDAKPKSK